MIDTPALLLLAAAGVGATVLAVSLAAMRRQARRAAEIVRTALDCIVTIDAEDRIVEFNPAAERTFGFRREEAIGRLMPELLIPERFRQSHRVALGRYLATGEKTILDRRIEVPALRADGAEILVELAVSRIATSRRPMFTAYMRDVTEARRNEEELRRTARTLAEANERQGRFLAMLSHELRNPLAPIRNAVEILRRRGADPAVAAAATDMIGRLVAQLVRLVNDLLDVNRIREGKIQLQTEVVDLGASLTQAIETAQVQCSASGQRLALELPSSPVWVQADTARIGQVVSNLLHNACKFTPDGGEIRLAVGREADEAVIRVRDSGVGIAAEDLERIFTMFEQVGEAPGRGDGGLGIGLSLSKTLVEMHGGRLEARSEGRGLGSEFVVRLPLARELPKAA